MSHKYTYFLINANEDRVLDVCHAHHLDEAKKAFGSNTRHGCKIATLLATADVPATIWKHVEV